MNNTKNITENAVIQYQHKNIIKDVLKKRGVVPEQWPKKITKQYHSNTMDSDDEDADSDTVQAKSLPTPIQIQYLGDKKRTYRYSQFKSKLDEAPPSVMTKYVRMRLEKRLDEILNVYDKVVMLTCPDQKRIISPEFIIHRCAELENFDKLYDFYQLPKTQETLAKYDRIWRRFLLECGWNN